MSIEKYPSIDYVRQCLREENGRLFWIERPIGHFLSKRSCSIWNRNHVGKEAGCLYKSGKKKVYIRCVVHLLKLSITRQTIVWALHKNEWRLGLDHKNRNSLDDRIENLRIATRSQNYANNSIQLRNTSGYKGVSWNKIAKKWRASIGVNKKFISLGYFDNPADAGNAYLKAAKEYFGEFASDGKPSDP